MEFPGIWPLFLAALGATTAVIWWRSRSQQGQSSLGGPPSSPHPRLAVVPVRNGARARRGHDRGLEGRQ
jgi:hypothetical protein